MSNTSSNDATSMEARVTQAGEAIGEHVKSATAATAAAAGQAQKIVEDAAAATVAAASQTRKATRAKRHSKLGRKRAGGRRVSLMRGVAPPNRFRSR